MKNIRNQNSENKYIQSDGQYNIKVDMNLTFRIPKRKK
jgi:hypothetical protein